MRKYQLTITREVEAKSMEEALKKLKEGEHIKFCEEIKEPIMRIY